jgi:mRNA interferase MazF
MINDWQVAGLIKASVFKPVFTTIEQNLVLRVLGRLSESDVQTLELLVGAVMRQSRTAQQNF